MGFLTSLPRLLRYSFWPPSDSAYPRVCLQRWLVMLLFWPLFLLLVSVNRLCLWLDDLLFPGYRQVQVREPWFVLGVPRSGTTFLHRLLAGDRQRFTTMSLWELVFAPSILQRRFWRLLGRLDRVVGRPLGRLMDWLERRALGGLDGVHKTGLRDPEEDYLALAPVLGCFLLILPFGDPAFWRLSRFDEQATAGEKLALMRFYRGLVQRHLYVHGRHRTYLSKNPSFTPMMQTLASHFPGARFVACVRTPDEAVPSQVSSILIGARLFCSRVDLRWWREGLADMLVHYYQKVQQDLGQGGAGAPQLVRMEQLAIHPHREVHALYRAFGCEPDGEYEGWLQDQERRARDYRSGHQYRGGAMGMDAAWLEARFAAAYRDFGYVRPGNDMS